MMPHQGCRAHLIRAAHHLVRQIPSGPSVGTYSSSPLLRSVEASHYVFVAHTQGVGIYVRPFDGVFRNTRVDIF